MGLGFSYISPSPTSTVKHSHSTRIRISQEPLHSAGVFLSCAGPSGLEPVPRSRGGGVVSNACSGRARMTKSLRPSKQQHAVMWSVSPHHPGPRIESTEYVPMRRPFVESRPVMSAALFPDGTAHCSLRDTTRSSAVFGRPGAVDKKVGSAPRTDCLGQAQQKQKQCPCPAHMISTQCM